MGFHDVRLPTNLSYGMEGGARYRTTTVEGSAGHEQRFAEWDEARYRWTVQLEYWDFDRLSALLGFFHARAGSAYGFRFKDWTDYTAGMVFGPDGMEYGAPEPLGTSTVDGDPWQLAKSYGDAASTRIRRITRPVAGTVRIYVNGADVTDDWTVDHATGIATPNAPVAPGQIVAWSGEFDVPARFESDDMSVSAEALMAGAWKGIGIVGIRE